MSDTEASGMLIWKVMWEEAIEHARDATSDVPGKMAVIDA
jgi:hypothetical protein